MGTSTMELSLPTISVIVCAFNEQTWIEVTIASILGSGFPCEVIVVDDGSTDQTPQILQRFGSRIRVITHPTNRGKGAALASGLRSASGEIVVFCDAHLLGLRQHHLLSLVLPLAYGTARAVFGIDIPESISPALVGAAPFFILTGQRAYFREDLLPLLDEAEDLGYGVEAYLFAKVPRDRTAVVLLPGLTHLAKTDTSTMPAATVAFLREVMEIIETLVRINGLAPKEAGQLRQRISALLAKYTGILQKHD